MSSRYVLLEQEPEDLRIVLVGKTGVGKSASGNTILRNGCFQSELNPSTVTSECQKETAEFDDKYLSVVDTPGLFDTRRANEEVVRQVAQCISFAAPGPHVFLIVLQLGRFTKEEQDTVKLIQDIFGREAPRYTMALFTRGDDLKRQRWSVQTFIDANNDLRHFVAQCGGGHHVFDNTDSDPGQVRELLEKIEAMVQRNGGSFYTSEMFQEAESAIREEMERHQREYPDMDLRVIRRRAETDNHFIQGVIAAALGVIGAAAGAGIELTVGAAIGSMAGPLGAALGAAVGLAVAGIGVAVKKKACTIQ